MKQKSDRITLTLISAAGFCLIAACATHDSEPALKAQARIPREAAAKTALAKVPHGKIQTSELEKEHGQLVWSFDLAMPKSPDITEVQVSAITGRIVSTEVETPADQAEEAAADPQAQKR